MVVACGQNYLLHGCMFQLLCLRRGPVVDNPFFVANAAAAPWQAGTFMRSAWHEWGHGQQHAWMCDPLPILAGVCDDSA